MPKTGQYSDFNEYSDEELSTKIYVEKLNKDIITNIKKYKPITKEQAVVIIRTFYSMQDNRIKINNQIKAIQKNNPDESYDALEHLYEQAVILEKESEKIINLFYRKQPIKWFFDQTIGIGPVLSAGLISMIDIHKAPYAGHIWSYAGLINKKWNKGEKRPWNAELKTLCWKIGQSFIKFKDNPNGFYGKLYDERKALYWKRNMNGEYINRINNEIKKERDINKLDTGKYFYQGQIDPNKLIIEMENVQKRKDAIKLEKAISKANGEKVKKYITPTLDVNNCMASLDKHGNPINGLPMLPPAHIDAMAQRYVVKVFLSHLHKMWWEYETNTPAPRPYIIEHGGHHDFIEPPQSFPKNFKIPT